MRYCRFGVVTVNYSYSDSGYCISKGSHYRMDIPYSLYLAHTLLVLFFKIALKMVDKIAFQYVHSENKSCFLLKAFMAVFTVLSEATSDAILGNGELKAFERKVNSNRKGTDNINAISKNPTNIKVFFIFTWSLMSNTRKRVRLCTYTCISEKNLLEQVR